MPEPIIEVRNLRKFFDTRRGFFGRSATVVKAVNDVSFEVRDGEAYGLVGESGCGKSTLGLTILRAHDPTDGEIRFTPEPGRTYDLARMDTRQLRPIRKEMQIIFQDPYSALSPRMTVRDIVAEPLRLNRVGTSTEVEDRVAETLREVGLRPQHMKRYPHAFSGGQRQRISIARALVLRPRFVVADEAVSALDVSVQAQILELLRSLKERFNLTFLFISHDLSVIQYFCDRVAVMYVGKIIEQASSRELFRNPRHPYTEALMSAIPIPDPARRRKPELLRGEVADPANPPSGCLFHPRCRYARPRCATEAPELRSLPAGDGKPHTAACHFAEELSLASILGQEGPSAPPNTPYQGGTP